MRHLRLVLAMPAAAPLLAQKAVDLEGGLTKGFEWQCLVARRMAERGVCFVELIDVSASSNAYSDIKRHEPLTKNIDHAIYGVLQFRRSIRLTTNN